MGRPVQVVREYFEGRRHRQYEVNAQMGLGAEQGVPIRRAVSQMGRNRSPGPILRASRHSS